MDRSEVNIRVCRAGCRGFKVARKTVAFKGSDASLAVVSPVSPVKGGTGLIVGRSISVTWLSTLFPLVTFLAKYRHFHN